MRIELAMRYKQQILSRAVTTRELPKQTQSPDAD